MESIHRLGVQLLQQQHDLQGRDFFVDPCSNRLEWHQINEDDKEKRDLIGILRPGSCYIEVRHP